MLHFLFETTPGHVIVVVVLVAFVISEVFEAFSHNNPS
jgi:hypothetical protein